VVPGANGLAAPNFFGDNRRRRRRHNAAVHAAYRIPAPAAGNRHLPRGIRNNNPLNLEYHSGQGAVGSDGRFGVYGSMVAGVTAAERQLLRYQDRYGLTTMRAMINRWAPPGENNSSAYASFVARRMGVGLDDKVSLRDSRMAESMVRAMARAENGREIDGGAVSKGIAAALGRPLIDRGSGNGGSAQVIIRHENVPKTVKTDVQARGGMDLRYDSTNANLGWAFS
jgi:hypothetical protein